ncbi:MAG TPA: 16S rRNA (cytosine(967)-C(5))-methyltransferase RsmB [Acholeplasmataceae bacterium]|nr:16S rRNA (cytosine(967)-C(5))-methyltransferase RsmB [Acholeplasmataceae bacterium]
MKELMIYQEAVSAITQVINQGGYINIVVDETLGRISVSESERRLFTKLVYGTVENKILIDYYLRDYTKQKRLKPYLKNTLRMAVYGLLYLNMADHFIVNTAVEIVKKKDYKGSRLINGVLRAFLKNPLPDLTKLNRLEYLSIKYSFPRFIVELLLKQYPEKAETILNTLSEESQKALRINTLKGTTAEVEARLQTDGISYLIDGNVLYTNQSMINHQLFEEGLVTYQDPSSQLVSEIVDPKPNESILDACSAPGGKTAHMAALADNQAKIVAVDVHEHKLKLMEENFERLGVENVELILSDARSLGSLFAPRTFDKALVDAPCSGLGVTGHKVDLKYQLSEEKIKGLIELQREILDSVAPLVKGELIYSTCTINQAENEHQMIDFLKRHPNARKIYEKVILPTNKQDGFYICKLMFNN